MHMLLSLQEQVITAIEALSEEHRNVASHVDQILFEDATKKGLQEIISLLRPFAEATRNLEGDGVTSSLVIPAVVGAQRSKFFKLSFLETHLPFLHGKIFS